METKRSNEIHMANVYAGFGSRTHLSLRGTHKKGRGGEGREKSAKAGKQRLDAPWNTRELKQR